MAFDDDSGWTEVLVDGWGPLVRAAVVDRVERAMVGRRGVLVRALLEESASAGHAACVEEVHERIVRAVREETGADLDELGSQAAWACYDEVWGQLQRRWATGGCTVVVARHVEARVVALVQAMSPTAAQHAGADVGTIPCTPMRVRGRVRVDVDGLFAHLATGDVVPADRSRIDQVVLLVRGRDPAR